MPKNDESFRDRLRKFTLLHWGGICMFASGFTGVIMTMQPAKNRAELLGRGIGVALGWVVGIVLVILHFVRRGRSKTIDKPRKGKSTGSAKRKPN